MNKPQNQNTEAVSTPRCTLSNKALQERREGIITKVKQSAKERMVLANGLSFHFSASAENFHLVSEFIDLERQCCAFLTIEFKLEPEQGPMCLSLTGPTGTLELLQSELGL